MKHSFHTSFAGFYVALCALMLCLCTTRSWGQIKAVAFEHTTTESNISGFATRLTDPSVINKPNAKIFVTPFLGQGNWFPRSPVAVKWEGGNWYIIHTDKKPMVPGMIFHVVAAEPSEFVFTSTSETVVFKEEGEEKEESMTFVIIKNLHPDAKLFFTQNCTKGIVNTNAVYLTNDEYNGEPIWVLGNFGNDNLPAGAQYNIMVAWEYSEKCVTLF